LFLPACIRKKNQRRAEVIGAATDWRFLCEKASSTAAQQIGRSAGNDQQRRGCQ
jgi:hypothetical protein